MAQVPTSTPFEDWCKAQGIRFEKLAVGITSYGERGVFTTQDIAANEVFFSAPEASLFSTKSAREDAALLAALGRCRGQPLPDSSILALHLLTEVSRGDASRWVPYLRSLPRTYTTLACFPAEAVPELQEPKAIAVARAEIEVAGESWEEARPALAAPELGLPARLQALPAWTWAMATIRSRTMAVPWDDIGALTPFGDLHNHAPGEGPFTGDLWLALGVPVTQAHQGSGEDAEGRGPGTGRYCPDTRAYTLLAGPRGVAAGQEVCLCYGDHSSLDLLQHYGFVLPANPHDRVRPPRALLAQGLSQAARAYTDELPEKECNFHATGEPSFALTQWARFLTQPPAALRRNAGSIRVGRPTTPQVDRLAAAWLRDLAGQTLATFPTTVPEDEARLAEALAGAARGGLQGHAQRCVAEACRYRMQLKQTLSRAVQLLSRAEAVMGDGCADTTTP